MSSQRFRLHAKRLFLTYSQCPLQPSVVSDHIKNFVEAAGKTLDYCLICQENHQDGNGLHLHALVLLKERIHIRNPRCLDISVNGSTYHPKIEPVRNLQKSIIYICKEKQDLSNVLGVNVVPSLLLKSAKKKSSTVSAVIASQVMEEQSLMDIVMENPGFALLHLKKIQDFLSWWSAEKELDQPKEEWVGCLPADPLVEQDEKISNWINSNFLTGNPRPPRTKQLWIHGPTSLGKTFLLRNLMRYFRGWGIPNESWDEGFSDKFDFAFCDEFIGQKTANWLMEFVEGTTMKLNRRGMAPFIKRKNIPVIICSNLSPSSVYSKLDGTRLEALEDRFLIVNVFSRIDIRFGDELYSSEEDDTTQVMSEISEDTSQDEETLTNFESVSN